MLSAEDGALGLMTIVGAVCANVIALSPVLMTYAEMRMKLRILVSLLVWRNLQAFVT